MAIPQKDSLLVPYSSNVDARINANPQAFGLVEQQAARYTTLHTPYVDAYDALMQARADGTQSKAMTNTKSVAKAALLVYLRELYGMIAANSGVLESNKILLGIHVREGGYTPSPAPTMRPGMAVQSVVDRTVELSVFDPAAHPSVRKPAGVKAALLYTYIGQTYPSDPSTWQFQGVYTRSQVAIEFPDTIAGGTQVWICAAWVGTRGETGPVSVPVSTFLQGGGTVQPAAMKVAA